MATFDVIDNGTTYATDPYGAVTATQRVLFRSADPAWPGVEWEHRVTRVVEPRDDVSAEDATTRAVATAVRKVARPLPDPVVDPVVRGR